MATWRGCWPSLFGPELAELARLRSTAPHVRLGDVTRVYIAGGGRAAGLQGRAIIE